MINAPVFTAPPLTPAPCPLRLRLMQKISITIARVALSAWIGAATLFVVTSISEQTSNASEMTLDVKNHLAALRFPWYYLFGFVLVGAGLISSAIGFSGSQNRRRRGIIIAILGLALALMVTDYVVIYSPLQDIVTRSDGVRDARFAELHRWSEQINTVDVTFCLMAAIAVCWPERRGDAQN